MEEQEKSAKQLFDENADLEEQEKSAKQLSDENADLEAQEKSAKQLFDENADLEAQEKSAKHMSDENADLITIKYTFYNDRNKIRRIRGMYHFLSPAYRFIKKCLMMLSYWLLTYVTLNFLSLSAA